MTNNINEIDLKSNKLLSDEETNIYNLLENLGYENILTSIHTDRMLRITAKKDITNHIGIAIEKVRILDNNKIRIYVRCEGFYDNYPEYQEINNQADIDINVDDLDKLNKLTTHLVMYVHNYNWFKQ